MSKASKRKLYHPHQKLHRRSSTARAAPKEEDRDHIELMTRGNLVKKGESFYITYKETETIGFEGCTTTIKIAEPTAAGWLCSGSARTNSPAAHRAGPAQPLPLRDRGRLPDAGRDRRRHRLQPDREGRHAPVFSYLLDADDASPSSAATRWKFPCKMRIL